ncbi:MAG TPA: GNAT family N-acetyltransferase [Planctomycetaceae bacterium]|nr:GNAT family N-acetyltransferase [Planctomycetaceae bacterium]
MNIDIQSYRNEKMAVRIGVLADFRLRCFREFPYLYVGTAENEREHLDEYLANPTARLVVAKDVGENKTVGVAIGTLLSTEEEIVKQTGEQLQRHGIVPERFFYFGEMIFEPEYRNRGIGRRMLEMLKNEGREQGADRFCFLAVAREADDVRRPVGHVDSSLIFEKFGFVKTPIFVTFEWPTIQPDGNVVKVANQLDLWIDRQP